MKGDPKMKREQKPNNENGVALIMVIVIVAICSIVVAALLFQSYTDRLVAINEQDHIKALTFADAGLSWAERRIMDGGSFSDLLDVLSNWGPCDACPEDLDESGAVDFGDLLRVLSGWGPC